MPLPDPSTLCVHVDADTGFPVDAELTFDPFALHVQLPGGLRVDAQSVGGSTDVPRQLLAQLNTALAPLQPAFDLIDFALQAKEVFDAVKTLNAIKIGNAVAKLPAKVDKLKAYVPQLSVPLLVKSVLAVVVARLEVVNLDLTALEAAQVRIDAAQAKAVALPSSDLAAVADCAQERNDAHLRLLVREAEPLNRLLGIINILCAVVGLPELPPLGVDGTVTISEYKAGVAAARAAMEHLSGLLPV